MNSQERVQRAIKFQGSDRVPLMHSTLPGGYLKHGEALKKLYEIYPSDFADLPLSDPSEYGEAIDKPSQDAWGAIWLRSSDDYKGQVVVHPLEDWSAFKSYRFPDPLQTAESAEVNRVKQKLGHEKYILVDGGALFQRMFYLRGFENLMVDLMEKRGEVYLLRDKIVEYIIKRVRCWHQVGVDGILIRDDWGMQDRLMISPRLWREFFKSAYGQIFKAIHEGKANVHFHTDGYTLPIIWDLIEVGVDEINLQLAVMDLRELGREFGGKVCIRSDIDRQQLFPKGRPEDVERYVKEIIDTFGHFHGGVIGWGEVGPDVPLKNVEAMLKTFVTYGKY